jgi:hypothetical protein
MNWEVLTPAFTWRQSPAGQQVPRRQFECSVSTSLQRCRYVNPLRISVAGSESRLCCLLSTAIDASEWHVPCVVYCSVHTSTLKIEAIYSSETSALFLRTLHDVMSQGIWVRHLEWTSAAGECLRMTWGGQDMNPRFPEHGAGLTSRDLAARYGQMSCAVPLQDTARLPWQPQALLAATVYRPPWMHMQLTDWDRSICITRQPPPAASINCD